MDTVVIFNGLGNQMSQYAFYLQKKEIDPSTQFITFCNDHNGVELERVFNINCKPSTEQKRLYYIFRLLLTERGGFIKKVINSLIGRFRYKIVRENFNYNFRKEFLQPSKGITFYFGGWHTDQYFIEVREEVLTKFKFNEPIDSENKKLVQEILKTNSVSVHIRRGDYLTVDNLDLFGDVCTKAYYEKAIEWITQETKDPHFFVFSNDMKWVKENLSIKNVTYVTQNTGIDSWKDMYLMTHCKHNIIANSTFSWWGAWLNQHEKNIVICPTRFLKNDKSTDVYPESWIKIV